jgi:hypothetical protein
MCIALRWVCMIPPTCAVRGGGGGRAEQEDSHSGSGVAATDWLQPLPSLASARSPAARAAVGVLRPTPPVGEGCGLARVHETT